MQQHTIHIHIRQFCLLLLCLLATEGVMGQAYKFSHYVGKVYDGTGTSIPDELKIPAGYDTYKTKKDDPRLADGVTLQRTHEYEREVWCFPGESCELLPFSDFNGNMSGKYHVTYIRWFDYVNDADDSHLSFDNNNTLATSSNNKGKFGGSTLTTNGYGYRAIYASENLSSDVLGIVGADFGPTGGTFSKPGGTSLTEPTLLWRHIFVVKNAKNRADEMMADNAKYVQDHKIKLMAPTGTPFQYRLDAYESQNWGETATPTGYWYKTSSSDTEYKPIYHYIVETWKENADGTKTLLGTTKHKNGASTSSSGLTSNLVYTFKENGGTARVLYMVSPTVGKYTIKVYAYGNTDADRDRSTLSVSSHALKYNSQPFQLMEFDLEIVDKTQGNMITEEELKGDDTYKYQRPSELEKLYGNPTTEVNFDQYIVGAKSATKNVSDGKYYPWPMAWDQSTYGCGYDNYIKDSRGFDYNAYSLVNNSLLAPYNTGATQLEADFETLSTGEKANVGGVRYDRKYEDMKSQGLTPQQGMMLFVNGAADPGRMAEMNIGKNFCTGTRVYVSAYISEFSRRKEDNGKNPDYEKANVAFSFKGVKADGTETTLSNFITGYITGAENTLSGYNDNVQNNTNNPNNGAKWMHIYYNFVPEVPAGAGFDHFIITMENNCVNSQGADYAIDDIRCFVCKPEVKVFQDKPICNGQSFTELRFEADFDILLTAMGQDELKTGSEEASFKYSFLDKDIFDEEMEGVTTQEGYRDAFDKALVKNVYNSTVSGSTSYGEMVYDCNFTKNKKEEDYVKGTDPDNKALRRTEDSGDRTLVFPNRSDLNDEKMKVNTEYIMAIMINPTATEVADKFDLTSTCAMTSNIKVLSSGEVKIDGKLASDEDGISVCANQIPAITVDMSGVKEGGEQVTETETFFDWYMGPVDEADDEKGETYTEYYLNEVDENGHSLNESMDHFRAEYPGKGQNDFLNKTGIDVPKYNSEHAIVFSQADYDCIKYFLDQKKLALYQQVDAINTYERYSKPLITSNSPKIYTTILPIDPLPDDEDTQFCLEPFEVIMGISDKVPSMKNGDDQGLIPYPKTMRDVPLRIGLEQLKKCCTLTDLLNGTDKPTNYLFMPLRDVNPYTATATDLDPRKISQENDPHTYSVIQRSEDDLVYLLASNDPNVNMKKSEDKSGARHAVGDEDVLYIGQVSDIVASRSTHDSNVCHLAFFEDFTFREGYWYTIKFHFQEDYSPGAGEVYDVCPGEVLCTIKVVPEYQMWTGAVDGNWNNDKNWRRVTYEELLRTEDTGLEAFVTDGETTSGTYDNDNTSCLVPADFTKVVIPSAAALQASGGHVPTLYDLRGEKNNKSVTFTGHGAASNFIKYMTLEDAEEAFDKATTQEEKDEIKAVIDAIKVYDWIAIGAASDTVNFDMASVDVTGGNVACRTWYDHTCDMIHFNSGAEIIGQQYLHYNKAWADVELEPGRWQTFACPIKNVIAGDFYLPTEPVAGGTYGARQDTPLFEDIYYKPALNDRFKPAVYQRSYNASKATIYHADGDRTQATVTTSGAPIKLDWSHVYNDANVRYEPGMGSAIKPDVSALEESKRPTKVKFRFPKADTEYTYYNPGDDDTGAYKEQDIPAGIVDADGNRTHRMIDINDKVYVQVVGGENGGGVLNAENTKYFLIGNPFMCHLSLNEFFAKNTGLEKKCWTVTEKGQRIVTMWVDEAGTQHMSSTVNETGFVGTDIPEGQDAYIAPFQSFFVCLSGDAAAKSFSPSFTPAMMIANPTTTGGGNTSGGTVVAEGGTGGNTGGNVAGGTEMNAVKGEITRSVSSVPESILRISALDNLNHETVMVLTDGEARPTKGAEALFDTNLSEEPMIYSTVKGQAMSIAQILPGDTIPIALMGVRDEVTLKLQGAANFGKPLYLVDAVTGEAQSLDGDITLKQSGNGVRYYLATRALKKYEEEITSAPLILTNGLHLTAKAPAGMEIDQIHIYAPNGACVAAGEGVGMQYEVTLNQSGIYLIHLVCNGVDYTYKMALQ